MAYCTSTDIENRFGKVNVETWADLDNDGDTGKIAARIAASIAYADDYIDSVMRHGIYPLPLQDDLTATPVIVMDLSAMLAGVWLYESRGTIDVNADGEPEHRLMVQKKAAMSRLQELKSGKLRIDNTSVKRLAPEVVTEDT